GSPHAEIAGVVLHVENGIDRILQSRPQSLVFWQSRKIGEIIEDKQWHGAACRLLDAAIWILFEPFDEAANIAVAVRRGNGEAHVRCRTNEVGNQSTVRGVARVRSQRLNILARYIKLWRTHLDRPSARDRETGTGDGQGHTGNSDTPSL